jgi:hypothetical protein
VTCPLSSELNDIRLIITTVFLLFIFLTPTSVLPSYSTIILLENDADFKVIDLDGIHAGQSVSDFRSHFYSCISSVQVLFFIRIFVLVLVCLFLFLFLLSLFFFYLGRRNVSLFDISWTIPLFLFFYDYFMAIIVPT